MNALRKTDDAESVRRKQVRKDFLRSLPQAELLSRSNGEFFTVMDGVWELEQAAIRDDWFNAIVRTEEQGNRLYAQMTSDESLSHPMSHSESSSLTNTVQRSPTRFDMFQNDTAEKAHLGFSNASLCHKAYGYLAEAATGKQGDMPEKRLKLLNGVKKEGNSRRSTGTGLKHHKFNKMYLERQGDYYDNQQPALIMIPICEIGEVLDWNGTDEYDVMAITVGGIQGEGCSEKVLKAAPSTCSRADVVKATELLSVFYKGIACSVRNHSVGESFEPEQLDFHSAPMTDLKKWWKLKKEVLEGDSASIVIPRVRNDLNWDDVQIARARASRENSLPDPFNMAVKAAINFSAIIGAKVMPACPDDDSSDEEMNSTQDDDTQWSQNTNRVDLSSLLQPLQSVI